MKLKLASVIFLALIVGCSYNPPIEFVLSSERLAVDIELYVAATLPANTPENADTRARGIWIIAKARQHADYLTMIINESPLVDSILELIREEKKEESDVTGNPGQ